ncbi:hypothetical protein I316_03221 [Kwoniella heveanensis BCC8398]|uniref:F-box domain-containing protein n=1 Tax=Kwoniella heveanensis BCC8398 TaxID=1296120 RepID=A0A1B9GVY9_9TREE|nr:hypothetical protein I316_03221 [Kwoniella heveanensis BCC8398]
MSMLDRLRMRAASFSSSTPSASSSSAASSPGQSYRQPRTPEPYEIPDPQGRTWLFALPDELLERVFVNLDRVSLTRCHRVCKRLMELLSTSAPINLHHTLQLSSLKLNPHALSPVRTNPNHIPPSKAYLLNSLRERLTRFKNFTPKNSTRIDFQEREGRLYEYLEGVLLRNVPQPEMREAGRELAIYDLTKMGEWEDVQESAENKNTAQESTLRYRAGNDEGETDEHEEVLEEGELVNDIRRTHKFGFNMHDFAVDPGQDLFVLAESRRGSRRQYTLHLHLLTLSTFEPHPLAAKPVLEWPVRLPHKVSTLGFQICDDGLFVLRNSGAAMKDHLCGWQWTTGRLAVTVKPGGVSTFESFVLLSPSSFIIPSVATRLRPDSLIQDNLADARDLVFSHHLLLYAFPPFSSVPLKEGEPHPPPHNAIQVAVIDLPQFHIDIEGELPPPRMTVRTDPPPRYTFPTHPPEMPQPFLPDPESGTIIVEFYCQPMNELFGRPPHYVMFALKKTFLAYLPAPASPLLFQAFPRPAPVLSWDTIAPKVRMIGPDEPSPSWVCYIYQNRYVVPYYDEATQESTVRLYDFDPLRIRRELFDRRQNNFFAAAPRSHSSIVRRLIFGLSMPPDDQRKGKHDGDRDGIHLVTEETVLKSKIPLAQEVRSGREMPFVYVEKTYTDEIDTVVMDGERIVLFKSESDVQEVMDVLEF